MKQTFSLALVATLVLACGGKSQPAPETPAADEAKTDQGEVAPAPARAIAAADSDDDQAARCGQVADHVMPILLKEMETMMAGMTAEQAEKTRAELAKELNKEVLVSECTKDSFSRAYTDCLLGTAAMKEIMACEKSTAVSGDDYKKKPDPSETAPPSNPDSPREGKYCDAAVDHVIGIMRDYMETEFAKMSKDQADAARKQAETELEKTKLVAECEKKGITKEQFDCILQAQAMDDLMKCDS